MTAGGSLGLVLGGVITQWASWRWVLFVNVPIGIAVILLTPRFVAETPGQPGRFDLPGAVTSTAGVAALVYAFIRAASDGWGDQLALAAFAAAAVLLAAFVLNETRAAQPITPLRLFAERRPLRLVRRAAAARGRACSACSSSSRSSCRTYSVSARCAPGSRSCR